MIAFLFFLAFILLFVVLAVYAERKVSAFIQDRLGPMEVGYYGSLQVIADLIKLLQKEDIVPEKADRKLFLLAPAIIFAAIFAGYAVLPLTPDIQGSGASVGVFYLLAIVSVDIIGLLIAGWSSSNKYSLFGAMRSVAQIVSYEIPLGLTVVCVVMISQTLNLQEISFSARDLQPGNQLPVRYQGPGYRCKPDGVGFLSWNIVRMPFFALVYIIFFIATLAECNRAPFDIPEAESELVGGFILNIRAFAGLYYFYLSMG